VISKLDREADALFSSQMRVRTLAAVKDQSQLEADAMRSVDTMSLDHLDYVMVLQRLLQAQIIYLVEVSWCVPCLPHATSPHRPVVSPYVLKAPFIRLGVPTWLP